VASLSQGRTAAAQCGLFTHKSVPVIFEPPCTLNYQPHWWRSMTFTRAKVTEIYDRTGCRQV